MARIKTFANGGTLLPSDLNSIEDDYEYAFSGYKETGFLGSTLLNGGITAASYYMSPSQLGVGAANGAGTAVFYFNPADYTANSRTNKIRLTSLCLTNNTASSITFSIGLYPVTASGGSTNVTPTVGSLISGTTINYTSPAVNGMFTTNSSDITPPAAGYYTFLVTTSGTLAASSLVQLRVSMQYRQV